MGKLSIGQLGEIHQGSLCVATDIAYGPDGARSISSICPRPKLGSNPCCDSYIVETLLPKSTCQIVPAYIKNSPHGPEVTRSGRATHDWIVNHYASYNLTSYQVLNSPKPLDGHKDLILLSGPIGNPVTKSLLGYRGSGNFLHLARDAFLPYEQVENEKECKSVIRRYENGALIEQPNWFIRTSNGDQIIPEFDENYFAVTEYLIVTHLITQRSTDRTITIFSGTQGLGTSIAGQVLEQSHLMEAVAASLNGDNINFQSLFKLRNIQHDHDARITLASGGIEHVATNVFEVPGL